VDKHLPILTKNSTQLTGEVANQHSVFLNTTIHHGISLPFLFLV
jgi:hypothetical protein